VNDSSSNTTKKNIGLWVGDQASRAGAAMLMVSLSLAGILALL